MFNIQHFVADVFYIMPAFFFVFTHPICGHQEACRTEVTKKNNDVAETQNTFSQEAGIILTTKKKSKLRSEMSRSRPEGGQNEDL